MRIYRLLIWILALMLNATGSPATEGEPEDPYEWLEDVSGAKPLTWAKERNAETVKELTRSADFQTLERRRPSDLGFRGPDPDRPEARAEFL